MMHCNENEDLSIVLTFSVAPKTLSYLVTNASGKIIQAETLLTTGLSATVVIWANAATNNIGDNGVERNVLVTWTYDYSATAIDKIRTEEITYCIKDFKSYPQT